MTAEKNEMLNVLSTKLHDLQKDIHLQCNLVNSILNDNIDDKSLKQLIERCPKRLRERKLEAAISEAIEVLDASRKAFKSKQLEVLRKKLTQTLIEDR